MDRSGFRLANRTQPALAPRKTAMLSGHCRQQGTVFDTGTSIDCVYMGVSLNWGYLFEGPDNKDYSILGSILGSPYFGELPTLNPKP